MVTAEILRELLHYDPNTGEFWWQVPLANVKRGDRAGTYRYGYRVIRINDETYPAHRLAWLYVHGVWPTNEIDHINRDRADNRMCNLREATRRQNMANIAKPVTNTSGLKGAFWNKNNRKWIAQISFDNKKVYLGSFESAEVAHAAYCQANARLNGQFANAG